MIRRIHTLRFNDATLNDIQSALVSLAKQNRNFINPSRIRREAAVLVPLCDVENRPSILFTERSRILNKHAGEIRYLFIYRLE
jgi:hypothetical protein